MLLAPDSAVGSRSRECPWLNPLASHYWLTSGRKLRKGKKEGREEEEEEDEVAD